MKIRGEGHAGGADTVKDLVECLTPVEGSSGMNVRKAIATAICYERRDRGKIR